MTISCVPSVIIYFINPQLCHAIINFVFHVWKDGTNFTINKELEQIVSQHYEKEYKLLSQYKKWEYDNRKFNEIKCFYGNNYSEEQGKRKWTFFFRLKQGLTNNFIDKISLKINSNSQGIGVQNVEITKYPFLYHHNIIHGQTVFSLIVCVHWKKSLSTDPTRINYDVVLIPEGKLLSYLFKHNLGKKGDRRKRNRSN